MSICRHLRESPQIYQISEFAESHKEHSEEQMAAWDESAEQAAATVPEVDDQARQDSAKAIQPVPVMMVCP